MLTNCRGKSPVLKPGSYLAPLVSVIGDVILEEGAALWYGAVARADLNTIHIGPRSNIQDNAVLHVTERNPLTVGAGVTVGHGAILHGCTIGDDCLIGMGSILMDGCVIGEGSIVAAGALVTQGTIIPPRSMVMGAPAKVRRAVTPEELEHNRSAAARYLLRAEELLEKQ